MRLLYQADFIGSLCGARYFLWLQLKPYDAEISFSPHVSWIETDQKKESNKMLTSIRGMK